MALFPFIVGRGRRVFVTAETVQNTYVAPASTDAIKVLGVSIDRTQDSKDRNDARLTRSRIEKIPGQTTTKVSINMYVMPSGTASGGAGSDPDCHLLLLSHFGTMARIAETSGGANDGRVTYTPSDLQTALAPLSLTSEANAGTATTGIKVECVSGFTPDVLKIDMKGGDEPQFTFEGEAYDKLSATYTTVGATVSESDATVTVADGAATHTLVDNGGTTRISPKYVLGTTGTGTGGAGYTITAVSGTTWSISPVIQSGQGQSVGAAMIPFVPTETTAGSPIAGILGTFSFDATTRSGVANIANMPITECSIERSNGIKYFHDVFGQDHMLDYVPGDTKVKVSFTCRARRDHLVWLSEHESAISTQYPVVLTCGNAAGRRMVVTMPRVRMDKVALDEPQGDEVALIKFEGEALGSAGADEITLAFT